VAVVNVAVSVVELWLTVVLVSLIGFVGDSEHANSMF
jgi:hypothetical protein